MGMGRQPAVTAGAAIPPAGSQHPCTQPLLSPSSGSAWCPLPSPADPLPDPYEFESDSDGGWGPHQLLAAAPAGGTFRAGRGGRGGRGRGRGRGRGGRGRGRGRGRLSRCVLARLGVLPAASHQQTCFAAALPPGHHHALACLLWLLRTSAPARFVWPHPPSSVPALFSCRCSYEEDDFSDEDYEPGGGGTSAAAGAALATAADAALPGGPQRIVVEAILAWRWPPALVPAPVVIPPAPVHITPPFQQPVEAVGGSEAAAGGAADGPSPMAVDAAAAVQPKAEPDAAGGGAEQHPAAAAEPAAPGDEQPAAAAAAAAEDDAVAALLSAGDASQPPPLPLPLPAAGPGGVAMPLPGMPTPPVGAPEDGAAAAAAALAAAAGLGPVPAEPEYLVKYVGRSHAHNEWVAESTLLQIAKRKVRRGLCEGCGGYSLCWVAGARQPACCCCTARPPWCCGSLTQRFSDPYRMHYSTHAQVLNFKKRYQGAPVNHMDPSWAAPERFVARRASPHGPGWEVLVKWGKLGYEHATWEARMLWSCCGPAVMLPVGAVAAGETCVATHL